MTRRKKHLFPQNENKPLTRQNISHLIPTGLSGTLFCAAFFALILGIYLLPHLVPSSIGTGYIIISLAMSALSVLAWRYDIITPRRALYLAIIGSVALMPLLPYTSNDTQRYLWDGAVFLSGLDPYVISPNNPLAADLRELWATPEEHAAYATLYPPGALSLFGLSSLAGPNHGIWVWKLMTASAAIMSLIAMFKLLAFRGLTRHFHLVAFCPLLIFEAGVGAHLDIFSLLGIVLALWSLDRDKIILAGTIIGLAATTKFLPAVIVGPLLFFLPPRKALSLFASSALTWLSVYGLMFGLGYKPLGLLPTFFEKWRGGAPFFPILDAVKDALSLQNGMFLTALTVLAIGGFSLSAWLANRGRSDLAICLCLSVPLLLSPILFPWYLLILIPFLALRPSVTIFLALTAVPLNYIVLDKWLSQGVWDQPSWPSIVLGLLIVTGLFLDVCLAKTASRNTTLSR